MEEKKRDGFASRLGFILVSAGCAIGIGNVWKFPYIAGNNGGAVFVLFYLVFLILMGIPVMTMELAVGRAGKKSAIMAFRALEKPGSKWHIHGWFCMAGCYLLMMYYTTVSGWMLSYFCKYASGTFEGISDSGISDVFTNMLANPVEMGIFMAVTVAAGFAVLSLGVQKGLERVTKIMMTGLLLLIIVLAVHSLTLSNAWDGLKFYLYPDWQRAKEQGIMNVMAAAMNQAFFTLSLGIGGIEVFGSYMSRDNAIPGEAVRISVLDTFVAVLSGLIIFPACFTFGVQPEQGPSLIFVALPRIFRVMPWGSVWGALFFVFMTFASFSTVTAVFENLIAFLTDSFNMSRGKAIVFNLIFLLIASVPCVLGYNVWSGLHLIGGRDVLDSEDFIVSNILLPLGSLIFLLFCVLNAGWGYDAFLKEANEGSGMKMSAKFLPFFKYVLPVMILIIFVTGLL